MLLTTCCKSVNWFCGLHNKKNSKLLEMQYGTKSHPRRVPLPSIFKPQNQLPAVLISKL